MEKFTKDISEIIFTEIKSINDKVRGLNFLELLKTNIIEKLFQLVEDQKFSSEESINYQDEINDETRNVKISINYYSKSISVSKKILTDDTLLINFNETTNIDIFRDEKNFSSLLLFKNTGISLPKETLINSKYNKNLLLIEIINLESYQILTK